MKQVKAAGEANNFKFILGSAENHSFISMVEKFVGQFKDRLQSLDKMDAFKSGNLVFSEFEVILKHIQNQLNDLPRIKIQNHYFSTNDLYYGRIFPGGVNDEVNEWNDFEREEKTTTTQNKLAKRMQFLAITRNQAITSIFTLKFMKYISSNLNQEMYHGSLGINTEKISVGSIALDHPQYEKTKSYRKSIVSVIKIRNNHTTVLGSCIEELKDLKYKDNPYFLQQYKKICRKRKVRYRHLRHLIPICLADEKTFINQLDLDIIDLGKFLQEIEKVNTKDEDILEIMSLDEFAPENIPTDIPTDVQDVDDIESDDSDIEHLTEEIGDILSPPMREVNAHYRLRPRVRVQYKE